jgi:hypothetical protein
MAINSNAAKDERHVDGAPAEGDVAPVPEHTPQDDAASPGVPDAPSAEDPPHEDAPPTGRAARSDGYAQDEPDSFIDELAPGTRLLQGQYTIIEYLNSGGFGITYLAKDSLDRTVVIKECFPGAFCRRSMSIVRARSRAHQNDFRSVVRLFVQEARSLAKLIHPNIVGVHQVFEDNDTAYMAIDYVDGRDLLELITEAGVTFSPEEIVSQVRKLLGAISFMHQSGVLHRDISPDNILISKTGEPILIDFGAAREQASKTSRALSALRVVKDGYSPQEFYIAGSTQGPSSDLYALAASYYHVIAGSTPPDSQRRLSAIADNGIDPYVGLAGRIEGFPEDFLRALDKAISILPKDRIQTADEWLRVLDEGFQADDAESAALRMTEIEGAVSRIVLDAVAPATDAAGQGGDVAAGSPRRAADANLDAAAARTLLVPEPEEPSVRRGSGRTGMIVAAAGVAAVLVGIGYLALSVEGPTETAVVAPAAPAVPDGSIVVIDVAPVDTGSAAEEEAARLAAAEEEAARVATAEAETARLAAAEEEARLAAEAEAERLAAEEAARIAVAEEAERLAAEEAERLAAEEEAERLAAAEIARLAAEEEAARRAAEEAARRAAAEAQAEAGPDAATPALQMPAPVAPTPAPVVSVAPSGAAIAPAASALVSRAATEVVLPFATEVAEIAGGSFPIITAVDEPLAAASGNGWAVEGIAIYSINDVWTPTQDSIEQAILAVPPSRDTGAITARVRTVAADGAVGDAVLTVPMGRAVELHNGVAIRTAFVGGEWRAEVMAAPEGRGDGLVPGDVIIAERATGQSVSSLESIETILAMLSARNEGTAVFAVQREGSLALARMELEAQ